MTFAKGSSRNPNGEYEMGVYKGSIRKPPVDTPRYEMAIYKGSIRRPPEEGPLGIEATVIKGSVRKPPVSERPITYN